jgi:hypothetical protein
MSQDFDPWLSNQDLLHVFNWNLVFGNDCPVEIDLGAGDGSFVLELAMREPTCGKSRVKKHTRDEAGVLLFSEIHVSEEFCFKDSYFVSRSMAKAQAS